MQQCEHITLLGATPESMEYGRISIDVFLGEHELPLQGHFDVQRSTREYSKDVLQGEVVSVYLLHYGNKIKIGTSRVNNVAARIYSQAPIAAIVVATILVSGRIMGEEVEEIILNAMSDGKVKQILTSTKPKLRYYLTWVKDAYKKDKLDPDLALQELFSIGEQILNIITTKFHRRGIVRADILPPLEFYYVNNSLYNIAEKLESKNFDVIDFRSYRGIMYEKAGFIIIENEKLNIDFLDSMLYRKCVSYHPPSDNLIMG